MYINIYCIISYSMASAGPPLESREHGLRVGRGAATELRRRDSSVSTRSCDYYPINYPRWSHSYRAKVRAGIDRQTHQHVKGHAHCTVATAICF